MSYESLRGQSILVTGTTIGIGRVTALPLAQAGAHVTVTARRATEGAAVVAEIKNHLVKAAFVQGSVADEAHVINAVEAAAGLTGKLKGAFNNAGVESAPTATVDDITEDFRLVFDINVLGVMLSMKHELRAMLKTGGGSIVNTTSIAGHVGKPEEVAKPVLFLLSSDAAFITGHDLLVDGGFTVP